ncbi:protein-disulfide oxidoreductase DsbI [Geobacter sulfurreducens]|uniref:protein-disulfide oxidoreductase DsbI n=1 Tax=Geobacter sulfurreducens TaxID=35554 RepID=UPI000DBBA36E|nr:protein-disulfide oxidoreductase DsbI [Geobacter sulfurreducens]BBA71517.1 Protein-disulfide oxidoreductase DsbI [Geobacter sulfurreducens]
MKPTEMYNSFKAAPIQTIAGWQDKRFLWILMAAVSLFMVILAHSVFQIWLYMRPCEQCVYIRFAFFCMAFGGIIAAIYPQSIGLKLVGYALAFWGTIQGIGYSLKLNKIHEAAHSDNPFGVQGCNPEPTFPFHLPLDKWSPEWFKPTGDCGYDNPIIPDGVVLSNLQKTITDFYQDGWYLWPPSHFMNMAQACLITFGICLLVLAVAAACWLLTLWRKHKTHEVSPHNYSTQAR